MRKDDIKFLEICVKNRTLDFDIDKKIKKLYNDCGENIEMFSEKILSCEDSEIGMSQEYALASKMHKGHVNRIMEMVGIDKWVPAASESGGLKIGNGSFSILIPNGYGDGQTLYAVLESGKFNDSMMDYFTLIEGNFHIFNFDCGTEKRETINGKYQIFFKDGLVVFSKI